MENYELPVDVRVKIRSKEGHLGRKAKSPEDLPTHEGKHPRTKEYHDRDTFLKFEGLRGMLCKGINRPWVNVYKEIVAHIKENYPQRVWHEMLYCVEWNVELSPMHVGDGMYAFAQGHPFYGHDAHNQYLVHPETGLLIHPKKEWCYLKMVGSRKFSEFGRYWDHDEVKYTDNGLYLRKINGIWHEVFWKLWPSDPNPKCQGAYTPYVPKEKDWYYQQNLYDVVIRQRLPSSATSYLAKCHGYYSGGKLVSRDYLMKKPRIVVCGHSLVELSPGPVSNHDKYIYADRLRQLSDAEIHRYGLIHTNLKVPDIVRKKKK